MPLPANFNIATPAGSDSPSLGDDQFRALKDSIISLFGIPDATNITVAVMAIDATGLTRVIFRDTAADPTTNGSLQRNGANLKYHNGTSALTLGFTTPLDVSSGGTGRTSLTTGRYLKGDGSSPVTLQIVPIPVTDGGTGTVVTQTFGHVIVAGASGEHVGTAGLTYNTASTILQVGAGSGIASVGAVTLSTSAGVTTSLGMIQRDSKRLMMGDGSQSVVLSGMISVDTAAVGNIGAGEDNLMTFTIPANTFNANGRGVRITATGQFAANGNTKTLRFYFGASAATVLNVVTTAPNNVGWRVVVDIYRSGSNTQIGSITSSISTVLQTAGAVAYTETDTAGIGIRFTGESGAAATNDIQQFLMAVELLN